MYVVIEYNQASGMPRVATDDVYDSLAEAREARDTIAEAIAATGRRERYEVFALDEIEV